MNSKQSQIDVIEMIARKEETLCQLYETYSDKFQDHRDFWLDIAAEETQHANWIRELRSLVEEGTVDFKEDRFNKEAIQTFIEYLERELTKAREQEMSLINALSTALYIEEALLERKFFVVYETDVLQLKRILLDIATSVEGHVQRVREA